MDHWTKDSLELAAPYREPDQVGAFHPFGQLELNSLPFKGTWINCKTSLKEDLENHRQKLNCNTMYVKQPRNTVTNTNIEVF